MALNLTKWLLVFYVAVQSCTDPVKAWGVEIVQDDFKVDFKDPSFVDLDGYVKDGLLYISYNIKRPASRSMTVKVEVYNHNGKKYIPVTVPGLLPTQNFCDFMESETMIIPHMMSHFKPVKPEGCPWPVGQWNLTGYKLDSSKLPPLMPSGKYRTKMIFGEDKTQYYAHSWYGRINKVK